MDLRLLFSSLLVFVHDCNLLIPDRIWNYKTIKGHKMFDVITIRNWNKNLVLSNERYGTSFNTIQGYIKKQNPRQANSATIAVNLFSKH